MQPDRDINHCLFKYESSAIVIRLCSELTLSHSQDILAMDAFSGKGAVSKAYCGELRECPTKALLD